jgi:hypothetical protein
LPPLTLEQKAIVDLIIAVSPDSMTVEQRLRLLSVVAAYVDLAIDQVHLISIKVANSSRVRLQMPPAAARRLIDRYRNRDPILLALFEEFTLLGVQRVAPSKSSLSTRMLIGLILVLLGILAAFVLGILPFPLPGTVVPVSGPRTTTPTPVAPPRPVQPVPTASPDVGRRLMELEAATRSAQSAADNAWMLVSAALVLMMTGPGLALFYGGLVRRKNVLGTMMSSFILMAVVTVLWAVIGYSLAFGGSGPFMGNTDFAFLNNVGSAPNPDYAETIPQQTFMVFVANS